MNRSLDVDTGPGERPFAAGRRSLASKFSAAICGLKRGVRSESNFRVHFFVAALVVAAGCVLRVSLVEWCLLVLCIAAVLAAEMFNTAIESLARAVSGEYDADIKDALDTSSGSVLIAAVGAAIVGVAIFAYRLGVMVGWWNA